jgi:hypothetical protein
MHFAGFNHSVWSAFAVLSIVVLAAGIAVVYAASRRTQWYYRFDPKHNPGLEKEKGEFSPHFARYLDLAKLVVTLSVGAVAFLINTLTGLKPPLTDFQARVVDVTPIAVGFFSSAIAALIAFMLLQTYFYEEYCSSPKHDSYGAWKNVLCNVLGWTGLVAFVCGFGWTAANVF